MDAAVKHCTEGIGIWQCASSDDGHSRGVVMACCGDVPTLETLAAVSILREHLPELKLRLADLHSGELAPLAASAEERLLQLGGSRARASPAGRRDRRRPSGASTRSVGGTTIEQF
jgi:hypothetical protein